MDNKYNNAKIYYIWNIIDEEIYVGSTCQTLSQRMTKHRYEANNRPDKMVITTKMNELGVGNFYIDLVEKYPCDDIKQLCRKEGEWTRKLGTLNTQVPGRTRAEYFREAIHIKQQENRDEYLHKKREYRLANIDKVRGQHNALYNAKSEEDRKQIYQQRKEWKMIKHECGCGSFYTNSHKSEHMKSKKHQKWET